MAYATSNSPALISKRVGVATGNIWQYTDGDPLATVIAADYISNGYNLGMKVGDLVHFHDDTLDVTHVLRVSAVTTDGAATLEVRGEAKATADLTAASTLTANQTGSTFFLNSATEFATTLPSPAAGLWYKFIVKAAPASASYTVVTASSANILIGGINELEVDTGDDGPYDNNGDTITFVDGVAVVGDYVELVSDGTSWYLNGQAQADGGITVTGS